MADNAPFGAYPRYATDASGNVTGLSAGGETLNLYAGKLRGGRAGAIGDSITANSTYSWFTQLCLISGGLVKRAVNAGVGSETTTQMAARIVTDLPKAKNLDLIFITGGTNDAIAGNALATTKKNIIGMVLYAQSIGADAVLVNIPPKNTNTDAITAIRAVYVEIARDYGYPLIDPWRTLVAADGKWLAGSSGGVHPYTAASRIAAEDAWNQLAPMLQPCWNGLDAISEMPGAIVTTDHFFPDDNSDGRPNSWGGYNTGGLVATKTCTAAEVGNKFRITTQGLNSAEEPVAGEQVEERTISGLTIDAGDRLAIAARVTVSGYATGIQCHVRTTTPDNLGIAPTHFLGDLDDAIVWSEITVAEGGITSIKQVIRLVSTGTVAPSVGYVEVSQMQIWNLTAMGIVG